MEITIEMRKKIDAVQNFSLKNKELHTYLLYCQNVGVEIYDTYENMMKTLEKFLNSYASMKASNNDSLIEMKKALINLYNFLGFGSPMNPAENLEIRSNFQHRRTIDFNIDPYITDIRKYKNSKFIEGGDLNAPTSVIRNLNEKFQSESPPIPKKKGHSAQVDKIAEITSLKDQVPNQVETHDKTSLPIKKIQVSIPSIDNENFKASGNIDGDTGKIDTSFRDQIQCVRGKKERWRNIELLVTKEDYKGLNRYLKSM